MYKLYILIVRYSSNFYHYIWDSYNGDCLVICLYRFVNLYKNTYFSRIYFIICITISST